MQRFLKNVSGSQIHIKDIGLKLAAAEEEEVELPQVHMYLESSDLFTAISDGDLQVGNGTVWYTDALEGECYFRTLYGDEAYLIEGSSLSKFSPVMVTDSVTGKKASSLFMNMLTIMRELYNASGDPLYDADFTPILGLSGWAEDHASRILNSENIHAKNGWHNQQITEATYKKPGDMLIYYGWLNSFNSASNGWDNEKVAQEMAKYSIVVIGDGIQDSSHGDYANTQVIIPRIKALNPRTKIFGYVTVNQTLANFEDKVDDWETLQVHGIFMDEAGYDYGKTRSEFNDRVDYVHSMTYANLCFANAWNMDHIIGTVNDTSYPNSTYNSSAEESNLTSNDWYLLESFAVNTLAYTGDYAAKADWAARGEKAKNHRYTYGINVAACGIIEDGDTNETALFKFSFIASLMFALEAHGTSDHYYGASSAKCKFVTRPSVAGLNRAYSLSPSIQVDNNDNDVYNRFVDFGKLSVDFSSGAETSSITVY